MLICIPCSSLVELAINGCPGVGADLEINLSCLVLYRVQPPTWLSFFSDPSVAPINVLVLRPDAIILISSEDFFGYLQFCLWCRMAFFCRLPVYCFG